MSHFVPGPQLVGRYFVSESELRRFAERGLLARSFAADGVASYDEGRVRALFPERGAVAGMGRLGSLTLGRETLGHPPGLSMGHSMGHSLGREAAMGERAIGPRRERGAA